MLYAAGGGRLSYAGGRSGTVVGPGYFGWGVMTSMECVAAMAPKLGSG